MSSQKPTVGVGKRRPEWLPLLRARGQALLPAAAATALVLLNAIAIVMWANGSFRSITAELIVAAANIAILVMTIAAGSRRLFRVEAARRASAKEVEDIKFALDQGSIVAFTDVRGRITFANDKFCEISKYSRDELLGQNHRILNSGHHPAEFFAQMWRTISGGKVWRGEIRNRAKDDTFYWVMTIIVPFLGEDGKPYQYVSIRTDITEKKLLEQERERLYEQARRALELRDETLAVVSHDLRNPLNSITLNAHLMLDGRRSPPLEAAPRRSLEMICRASERMDRLIGDLLFAAKIDSGNMTLESKPENAGRLLYESLDLLEPAAAAKAIRIERDAPAAALELECDSTRLSRVISNLVGNAIKFSPESGVISVGVRDCGDSAEFWVKDQGPGIPSELVPLLFQRYAQSRKTAAQGTGLGLFISKGIVEAHQGKISVETTQGKGSTFRFVIPKKAGPAVSASN